MKSSANLKLLLSRLTAGVMMVSSFAYAIGGGSQGLSSAKAPVYVDSFEGQAGDFWEPEMPHPSSYSGAPSTDYALSGEHSFRIELRKDDPDVQGSRRSEMALSRNEKRNVEHTYSFATLLPDGGDEDYALDPEGSEIIAQWHNVPDPGEGWTTPPLALVTSNGRYWLGRCWDDAPITSSEQMVRKGNRAWHDLGSYLEDKGRFVRWSFHIKWGWKASQDPRLEVFKDGVKVLDLDGRPNTTNDKIGVYFKFGIYKWEWAEPEDPSILSRRVIYYDDISIQ